MGHAAVLTYFVVCGVSRLARFNVTVCRLADATTGKVKYFEGTPIPTSILIVGLLAVALGSGSIDEHLWLGAYRIGPAWLHPLALVYRGQRQRDDQRDAEDSEALIGVSLVAPPDADGRMLTDCGAPRQPPQETSQPCPIAPRRFDS